MRVEREMTRLAAAAAGALALTAGLAACGPNTIVIDAITAVADAPPGSVFMPSGQASVLCVMQADMKPGECEVEWASPNTAEVRDVALVAAVNYPVEKIPTSARKVGGKVRIPITQQIPWD